MEQETRILQIDEDLALFCFATIEGDKVVDLDISIKSIDNVNAWRN